MASLEIHTGDRRLVYQILEDELTVGKDASNHVRVQGDRVAACHLRLWRTGGTFRVAATDRHFDLRINGERRREHELAHGDRVEIGDAVLVFLEADRPRPAKIETPVPPAPAPPSPRPAPGGAAPGAGGIVVAPIRGVPAAGPRRDRRRVAAAPAPDGRRRRRRRGMPRWLMLSNLLALSALSIVLLIQWLSSSGFGRDPSDLVSLAESQFRNGDLGAALATLDAAAQRGPTPATTRAIADLRGRIDSLVRMRADRGPLEAAGDDLVQLQQFETAWLARDPSHRGASRELVRRARHWLEQYQIVCSRYAEYRALCDTVEGMLRRYTAPARLEEPDSADDALFVAETRIKLRRRRYLEAIDVLERWLVEHPGADGEDRVRERMRELEQDGPAWVADRLASVERMVAAGREEQAIEELRFLCERGGKPEWLEAARVRLQELSR